jgi:hypothetical protein
MMNHTLKCWAGAFERILGGEKTFDVRLDDRGFQCGDMVLFQEFDPESEQYSGRSVQRQIGYVAKGDFFGLRLSQYAILSLIEYPTVPAEEDMWEGLDKRVEYLETQVHMLREKDDPGYLEDEATQADPDGGLG